MSNAVDHDLDKVPMSADVDDHAYAGSRVVCIPTANGFGLTGIDPGGTAGDGREIVIVCADGAFSFTVRNNNAGSASANRILTPDGLDIVLSPRGTPGGTNQLWAVRNEDATVGAVGWWAQP